MGATSCGRVDETKGRYASAVEQALEGKQQAERQRNQALLLDLVLAIGLALSLLQKRDQRGAQRAPQTPGTVNGGAVVLDAQNLVESFRTQLTAFEGHIAAAGGVSGVPAVVIPVQPTLGNMMKDIDGHIVRLSAAFQEQPHLPAAIIRRFDDMKRAINSGDMRTAIQIGQMIQGAIHFLITVSSNPVAPQDRNSMWREFVTTRRVPEEWLSVDPSANRAILNLFRILGVDEVDQWSSDFERAATRAYRQVCFEGAPERLQYTTGITDAERKRRQDRYELVIRTGANNVLTNRDSFGIYIDALQYYRNLPN